MSDSQQQAEQAALAHALAFFHANHEGTLEFDDGTNDVKFIVDPASGRIVLSAGAAAMLAGQHVLHVPALIDDALQLLLSVEEVEESAITDRWMAHHAEPEHVHWAMCWVDSARHGPWVFDGGAFMQPNPLASIESHVCKTLNAHKQRLVELCHEHGSTEVKVPTCVGVDPWGISIRARFGVVRLSFEEPVEDTDAIENLVAHWVGEEATERPSDEAT